MRLVGIKKLNAKIETALLIMMPAALIIMLICLIITVMRMAK